MGFLSEKMVAPPCPYGEIGKRAGFKSLFLTVCWFESSYGQNIERWRSLDSVRALEACGPGFKSQSLYQRAASMMVTACGFTHPNPVGPLRLYGRVAKLADALALGASRGNSVQVRLLSCLPERSKKSYLELRGISINCIERCCDLLIVACSFLEASTCKCGLSSHLLLTICASDGNWHTSSA